MASDTIGAGRLAEILESGCMCRDCEPDIADDAKLMAEEIIEIRRAVKLGDDDLDNARSLAKDLDFKLAPDGSKLTLVYDGFAIFVGSVGECVLYMKGWRDGRHWYIEKESRGANE